MGEYGPTARAGGFRAVGAAARVSLCRGILLSTGVLTWRRLRRSAVSGSLCAATAVRGLRIRVRRPRAAPPGYTSSSGYQAEYAEGYDRATKRPTTKRAISNRVSKSRATKSRATKRRPTTNTNSPTPSLTQSSTPAPVRRPALWRAIRPRLRGRLRRALRLRTATHLLRAIPSRTKSSTPSRIQSSTRATPTTTPTTTSPRSASAHPFLRCRTSPTPGRRPRHWASRPSSPPRQWPP